jgi:hypothetical protein
MTIKHEEILQAVKDRKTWEDRQATWYQMRHDGLRRRNKPWPNAADLHFPLADTLIEKTKPGYVQQVFAPDTVASFTALKLDWRPYQSAAGQWFDYQLKQESNFEEELTVGADCMLQNAKGVLKVFWCAKSKKLKFESIAPAYIIVPKHTTRLQEADWVVHVQRYSKHAYRRLPGFAVDEATITAIAGGEKEAQNMAEQVRVQREGITKGATDDEIVVWELFWRDEQGKVHVRTYSPADSKRELRAEFILPYNKGLFAEAEQPYPFFELNAETKERGYYSPRGICERVAPFEAKLCKDWNTHSDDQTIRTQPVFEAPNGLPNTANLKMVPGQILPFALKAVQIAPSTADLMGDMMTTRQVAQELIGALDYGAGGQQNPKDRKTATEVNLIGSMMGQSNDLRARTFRRELTYGLKLAWAILMQYRANALQFFVLDELQELPAEALAGQYRIELNGSGDNNNRQLQLQKATARMEMFKGAPFIDQIELAKSVLEIDDPRLVKRLVINQGTEAAMQLEDQAQEISILLLGFPAQVRPTDEDVAHLDSMLGFLSRRVALGLPLGDETTVLMAQHAQEHAAQLAKKQPDAWKQQHQAKYGMPLQQLGQAALVAMQRLQAQQGAQMPPAALTPGAAPAAMAA